MRLLGAVVIVILLGGAAVFAFIANENDSVRVSVPVVPSSVIPEVVVSVTTAATSVPTTLPPVTSAVSVRCASEYEKPETLASGKQICMPDHSKNISLSESENLESSKSTTTTTRPPRPECSGHRKSAWNKPKAEWQCVKQTWREAGISCSAIQSPIWSFDTFEWYCGENYVMKKECLESMEWVAQSSEFEKSIARAQQILDRDDMRVATVTGRQPSETLCIAKGFGDNSFAVCTNSDYIYIMRVVDSATVDAALRCLNNLRDDPTAPQCETGLLDRWVDGELLCYTPCEDDTYQHFDSEGRQWCHSPPECGTQLIAVYVSSINRYNCGETEEMAEQFWQYAFQTLGISEEDRKARWIGGFAKTYNLSLIHI